MPALGPFRSGRACASRPGEAPGWTATTRENRYEVAQSPSPLQNFSSSRHVHNAARHASQEIVFPSSTYVVPFGLFALCRRRGAGRGRGGDVGGCKSWSSWRRADARRRHPPVRWWRGEAGDARPRLAAAPGARRRPAAQSRLRSGPRKTKPSSGAPPARGQSPRARRCGVRGHGRARTALLGWGRRRGARRSSSDGGRSHDRRGKGLIRAAHRRTWPRRAAMVSPPPHACERRTRCSRTTLRPRRALLRASDRDLCSDSDWPWPAALRHLTHTDPRRQGDEAARCRELVAGYGTERGYGHKRLLPGRRTACVASGSADNPMRQTHESAFRTPVVRPMAGASDPLGGGGLHYSGCASPVGVPAARIRWSAGCTKLCVPFPTAETRPVVPKADFFGSLQRVSTPDIPRLGGPGSPIGKSGLRLQASRGPCDPVRSSGKSGLWTPGSPRPCGSCDPPKKLACGSMPVSDYRHAVQQYRPFQRQHAHLTLRASRARPWRLCGARGRDRAAQVQVTLRPLAPPEAFFVADLMPGSAGARPDLIGITLVTSDPTGTAIRAGGAAAGAQGGPAISLEITVARESPSPAQIFRGTTDPFVLTQPVRHLTLRDLASRGRDVSITDFTVNDAALQGPGGRSGRLPAGTYLFRVVVRNAQGTPVERDELRITSRPPPGGAALPRRAADARRRWCSAPRRLPVAPPARPRRALPAARGRRSTTPGRRGGAAVRLRRVGRDRRRDLGFYPRRPRCRGARRHIRLAGHARAAHLRGTELVESPV